MKTIIFGMFLSVSLFVTGSFFYLKNFPKKITQSTSVLSQIPGKYLLLFINERACKNSCKATIETLKKVHQQYKNRNENKLLSIAYLKGSHLFPAYYEEDAVPPNRENFFSLYTSQKQLHWLQSKFHLYTNQLQQSKYIYLFYKTNKKWNLKFIFLRQPPHASEIYQKIIQLQKQSKKE
ncbi:MAG: hypothetical protein ACI86H_001765 [bacterium]|jgi:hypothetical protein